MASMGRVSVTPDQLTALRDHFADGHSSGRSRVTAYTSVDSRPTSRPVVLRVTKFTIPELGADVPLIAADGSGANLDADGHWVSGCAAVAADGRVLAAEFTHPPTTRQVLLAEWQGFRLAMRLAAAAPARSVTIIVDNRSIAGNARKLLAGGAPAFAAIGGNDPEAIGEIRALAAARTVPVTIALRPAGGLDPGTTAATRLGACAHTAAWLIRRMTEDGIALSADSLAWLAGRTGNPPSKKSKLQAQYMCRFGPSPG
jgi:hypothetical protein